MQDKSSDRLQGLTTAAMLWVCAVSCIAFASGQYVLDFAGFALAFLYLLIGEALDNRFLSWQDSQQSRRGNER